MQKVSVYTTRSYIISGLTVRSSVEIPDATEMPYLASVADCDVEITVTSETQSIDNARIRTNDCEIGECDFIFRPRPGLAFRVRRGREIIVNQGDEIGDGEVRLFLVGTAWGVLCHQRGLLPLHASAVVIDDHAVAIAAPSGTGKSTLAAALACRGYPLLADDVCVVDLADSDSPMAYPMPAKGMKLWQEAAKVLDLELGGRVDAFSVRNKHYVEVPRFEGAGPVRLSALYVLGDGPDGAMKIEALRGGAMLTTLAANVYRAELVNHLRDKGPLFQQVAQLCGSISSFRFNRPRDLSDIGRSLDYIEKHMQAGQSAQKY